MLEKIKKIVTLYPNRIAYEINEEKISYIHLWSRATYYSKYLMAEGFSPIVIYGEKSIDYLVIMLACIIANRTYIPASLDTPKIRLKDIIRESKSTLMICQKKIFDINIKQLNLDEIVKIDVNVKNFKMINEIVYIIFTSGSTGKPKGVGISKKNLNNFILWISNLMPLKNFKNSIVLNVANFSFDLSVADLYYSLCNGHTLISLNFDILENSNKFINIMKRVNFVVMTPTFCKLCLLVPEFNSNIINNLKCIYFCGETLEIELVKKLCELFPNIDIINAYGPTEATSAVSAINITKDMLNYAHLPVGKINNSASKIEIINKEIVIKGESVSPGYINKNDLNFYTEDGIRCYKTGDLGYIENKLVYCIGRKDNQIKYKGYRIELNDIENNIKKIPEIVDCIVVAKRNKNNNVKGIHAYCTVNNKIDEETIKKKLQNFLPKYMLPKTIKVIQELPINENYKIDRKKLFKYDRC